MHSKWNAWSSGWLQCNNNINNLAASWSIANDSSRVMLATSMDATFPFWWVFSLPSA